jgi:fatty-acyl-CoA synthase
METPLTPLEFARRTAKLYPERIAVIDGDLQLTYCQFFERCNRWSSALQGFGVLPSDRVAYIAPNTHAELESFYSVPQIGAILVPINYRLSPTEFSFIINHCGARIVCVDGEYIELVESIRKDLPSVERFIALEGHKDGWLEYETILADASPLFIPYQVNELDTITINYTSGTTARPKGAMISHRNACMNTLGTLIHCQLSSSERYLWTLPMFHGNGWTFVWTVTACGGLHICLRKVNPENIFQLIIRERVTLFCAAPTILIWLANADHRLKKGAYGKVRVITAGAPPAATTLERIERELGWTVLHVYGMTETSPFISICEPRPEHERLTPQELANIKARQGVELITSGELKVVDEEDREVPRDSATLGEIVVRGNVVMKGYFNDPEATNNAMRGGWFHTGDAAIVHPDGYIEIRDRIKDVIISGGENISSIEVENILLRHPAVQESAVVGMPHSIWGESPHAFIVLREGESVSADEIKEFVGRHLASFKKPQWVSFVTELPKTATGKIQKYVLRGGRAAIAKQ